MKTESMNKEQFVAFLRRHSIQLTEVEIAILFGMFCQEFTKGYRLGCDHEIITTVPHHEVLGVLNFFISKRTNSN